MDDSFHCEVVGLIDTRELDFELSNDSLELLETMMKAHCSRVKGTSRVFMV